MAQYFYALQARSSMANKSLEANVEAHGNCAGGVAMADPTEEGTEHRLSGYVG